MSRLPSLTLALLALGCSSNPELPDAAQLDAVSEDAFLAPGTDAAAAADAHAMQADAAIEPIVIDDTNVPPEAALYTLDGTRYGIHGITEALDAVTSSTDTENVILYVHGRGCGGGGEPAKSLEGAMPEMAPTTRRCRSCSSGRAPMTRVRLAFPRSARSHLGPRSRW